MYLLIPIPLLYTLFDQQGSRWILQGTLMNGKIDFLNWSIKPDQVHFINPLFVLIFIPLFNGVVYPILYEIGINTPLKKVTLGGLFTVSSFGQTLVLPSNEGQLRIINNFDCGVTISGSLVGNVSIEPLNVLHINYSLEEFNKTDVISIDVNPMCQLKTGILQQRVFIVKERVSSYFLTSKNNDGIELTHLNELKKLKSGNSNLRISYSHNLSGKSITLRNTNNKLSDINFKLPLNKNTNHEIPVGTYDVYLDDENILQMTDLLPASVNDLIFHHSFNQTAPLSMKSFISAANLCTQAVGNLLIVIISKMKLFENQLQQHQRSKVCVTHRNLERIFI
ncbi:solute carrier family 15 member 1-like [Rhopalosiphum padi]|uniref:solute carrier family 15 member 1-like n=1 Tax=Rhopalosiphum padi TaxID=40932 RepID=UPI00298DF352|nr:solute carrier family 15 member 1-like [Rhopalosiphum padi]